MQLNVWQGIPCMLFCHFKDFALACYVFSICVVCSLKFVCYRVTVLQSVPVKGYGIKSWRKKSRRRESKVGRIFTFLFSGISCNSVGFSDVRNRSCFVSGPARKNQEGVGGGGGSCGSDLQLDSLQVDTTLSRAGKVEVLSWVIAVRPRYFSPRYNVSEQSTLVQL